MVGYSFAVVVVAVAVVVVVVWVSLVCFLEVQECLQLESVVVVEDWELLGSVKKYFHL